MEKTIALRPSELPVRIGGRQFIVRALSFRQTLQIVGIISRHAVRQERESWASDVSQLIALARELSDGEISELLAILLGASDAADLAALHNVSLEDMSEFLTTFAMVNNFEKIISNFHRIGLEMNYPNRGTAQWLAN